MEISLKKICIVLSIIMLCDVSPICSVEPTTKKIGWFTRFKNWFTPKNEPQGFVKSVIHTGYKAVLPIALYLFYPQVKTVVSNVVNEGLLKYPEPSSNISAVVNKGLSKYPKLSSKLSSQAIFKAISPHIQTIEKIAVPAASVLWLARKFKNPNDQRGIKGWGIDTWGRFVGSGGGYTVNKLYDIPGLEEKLKGTLGRGSADALEQYFAKEENIERLKKLLSETADSSKTKSALSEILKNYIYDKYIQVILKEILTSSLAAIPGRVFYGSTQSIPNETASIERSIITDKMTGRKDDITSGTPSKNTGPDNQQKTIQTPPAKTIVPPIKKPSIFSWKWWFGSKSAQVKTSDITSGSSSSEEGQLNRPDYLDWEEKESKPLDKKTSKSGNIKE